jgi:hypothetical protein
MARKRHSDEDILNHLREIEMSLHPLFVDPDQGSPGPGRARHS